MTVVYSEFVKGFVMGKRSFLFTCLLCLLISVQAFPAFAVTPQVSAGYWHTVGLKSDGTVLAVGENNNGQCNMSGWSGITQASAGSYHTIGLKSDGTVMAVGANSYGQCNVSGWSGITQVSAGANHTVGLKSDGTVVAVGFNGDGRCDVSGWIGIIQVSAGFEGTVGLKPDGTLWAVGDNFYGQCDVSSWNLGLVQPPRSKFWGIFIGQNFLPLDDMRGDLIAKDIYGKCHFLTDDRRYLITDDGVTPVTKGQIEEVINKIKLQIKPGDTLFFYLVGHGYSSLVFGHDETTITDGDEYVVLNDTYLPDFAFLTDDELKSMLEDIDNVKKWVFVDACHSGGFWGNNNQNDVGDLEKLPNLSMLAAAREDGPSTYLGGNDFKNHPDYGKTTFGILLRDGLALKANNHANCDLNDDGDISFDELRYWMTEQGKSHLGWINGLTLRTNDFGDEIVFSIDDWEPVCEKTDDFTGTINSVVQNDLQAQINGPAIACTGRPVVFDASSSYSPNGSIVMYEWDWNGDSIYEDQTNSPQIAHTFTSVYDGTVVLRITDAIGFNDTTSISMRVTLPPDCPCDLNSDGKCNMQDWLSFGQRWGATNCNTVPCACDLNADGRCDMRDWLLFGQDWGRTNCPIP